MLKLKNIKKSFGNHLVLDDVSVEVNDGEVLTLIGPSGTGKSTLLRIINQLETVDAGEIYFEGLVINDQTTSKKELLVYRRQTAMVFQQYNLFQHLRVIDNIVQPQVVVNKVSKVEARKVARKLLKQVGLEKFENYFPVQLSGGQQQRVSIARALALNPKIILFDEPTSALDPELSKEVLKVIRQVAQSGIITILATHEMQFAEEISNKVIFMEDGKIVESGSSEQIFRHPKESRTSEFLSNYDLKKSVDNYQLHLQIAN